MSGRATWGVDVDLRVLPLKHAYDSDSDSPLDDFYVPALMESVQYQRLAGFFSSSVLAVAARGITGFVKNQGHMQLICGASLTEGDVEVIKRASDSPEQVIEKSGIRDLSNLEDEM